MNIDCNPSSHSGMFQSMCRLLRLFLVFGMVLVALSAQAEWGKPAYPVIFIHGINTNADDTWGDFRKAVVANKWNNGGSPRWNGSTVTGVTVGDFYTLNFSSNHDLNFFAQGFELSKIISAVVNANNPTGDPAKQKVILVAHSMGGLAARAYLQSLASPTGILPSTFTYEKNVQALITVGTPHQGSRESERCRDTEPCNGKHVYSSLKPNDVVVGNLIPVLMNPDSIAFNALIPESPDLKTLNSNLTNLPTDVRYVSIVATWKYENGNDRNTLTKTKPTLWEDGGDGIVTKTSQDFSKLPGFSLLPLNHTVVPVTFHDPLWNFLGITLTGAACGNQIATPYPINEVHTCETRDASVAYYIVQSIIAGTSTDAGLPMLQTGPVSYVDGTGQIHVGLGTFSAAPMSVQCRYGSDPSLLDPLLTSTTTVNALSFLQSKQSSSCAIPVVQGLASHPIYYQAVAQAGTTTATVILPTDPNTSVGPIHQILVPPAGGASVLLPAPTGLSPASGSTYQAATPTLTWNTVTGATSYRIMLVQDATALPIDPTDGNCDRCLVDFVPDATNRTSYTPPAGLLTAGTTYYWQVHARSPDNFGAWTAPSSFTTQPTTPASLLSAPTQTAPDDNASGQSTMPTLSWTPVAGATSYRIVIAPTAAALTNDPTSADCPTCLTNAVVPGAQGSGYVPYLGLLAVGSTYYWSVKARSPDSYGAWSAVRSFTPTAIAASDATIVTRQPGPGQGKNIWTTSVYSYASGGGGPGGGLDNDELRVGGWGDLYYSLLQFDLSGLPNHANSVVLRLYANDRHPSPTTPTEMYLDRIDQPWSWQDRLWWANRPAATQWRASALPVPTLNAWYEIDVTDLYNAWQIGTFQNYGMQLRPIQNSDNFNTFYSSDYLVDPTLRPMLLITTDNSPKEIYTLSVSTSGSGTVTSSPSGINCGTTCTSNFTSGISVTLTAKAETGSNFAGWSGGGCSGTGSCAVTMNAAQNVTASFGGVTPTSAPTTSTSTSTSTSTTTTTSSSTVATTTTTTQVATGLTLTLPIGWNLLGNGQNQSLPVATLLGDTTKVTTVWKWIPTTSKWAFYAPSMNTTELATYASGKGYDILTTINGGEGFWVNAKTNATVAVLAGTPFNLSAAQLVRGWNLVATADDVTPSAFNLSLTDPQAPPSAAGVVPINLTTLWAWDNLQSQWYFYAPNLEAQGGTALKDYIVNKGYLDFAATHKLLGPGLGFWVNKP